MRTIERIILLLAAIITIIVGIATIVNYPSIKCWLSKCETSQPNISNDESCTNNSCNIDAPKLSETGQDKAAATTAVAQQSTASKYNVGDIITFGSYPYYANGGEKAIDWKILDIDANNNALVISDYALDNVEYNEKYVDITWEDSSIRKWLNNDFLNKAFSPEQRRKIISSRITNKGNANHKTRGGNATTDKLFLLSIDEASKYFKDNESRIAYPTPYAKSKKSVNGNLWVSEKYVSTDRGGSCWWWLRSIGDPDIAADVNVDGYVLSGGLSVNDDNGAVRVALKINLNNL